MSSVSPLLLALPVLVAWSYSSEQQPGSEQNERYVYGLLAVSAAIATLGRLLGLRPLQRLTRALDAYALSAWAGLRQRRELRTPLWLTALFVFSLPLERLLQRLCGYQLQQQLFVAEA